MTRRTTPKIKQLTPLDTAKRMHELYGNDWRINATYNLMQYDRDTEGWAFWIKVLNTKLKGE